MADNRAQYGLRFHRSRAGSATPYVEIGKIASGYGGVDANSAHVDVNVGDPVKKVAGGTLALAQAGDAIFGVIHNILPYSKGDGLRPYTKLVYASTGTLGGPNELQVEYIPIADNIFEIDCDDAVTCTTIAQYEAVVGHNSDIILAGDTGTTSAKPVLDISIHGTGTAQVRIVGISPSLENVDPSGANFKLLVTGNEVQQAPFQPVGV